jgi:hypothetical protein
VFDPATTTFLESGCALIVGSVDAGGEPYATRGWGLTLVSREPVTVRLLLDPDEERALENLKTTGRVAITATSVPTAASMQLKGSLRTIEPALDADIDRAAQYCDDFFHDIVDTDRTPAEIVERLRPERYVACIFEIDEVFDQTPGPSAGTSMSASATGE